MHFGEIEVQYIHGGNFYLDGGAMFGVVPKPLWEKKSPPDDRNRITLAMRPLIVAEPMLRAPRPETAPESNFGASFAGAAGAASTVDVIAVASSDSAIREIERWLRMRVLT